MTLRHGATAQTLRHRADILSQVRAFFTARGVLEVETAAISGAATPDPALQSIRARGHVADGFLHTSPEYMMKRLLADGSGDIYQLCRVFRDGELGRWHEPEFVLLEWYRTGYDEHALMDEVDALVSGVLGTQRLHAATRRLTYDDVLQAGLAVTSETDSAEMSRALRQHGVDVPARCTHDDLLDLAMATLLSAQFPSDALTFVYDYPVSQAALAQINPGERPRAARFEVFLGELELGNGFHELTDADEQRARFEQENAARIAAGLQPVPVDEPFLAALSKGLPDCSGVALGFDRLVAAALGAESIAEVIAFTHAT